MLYLQDSDVIISSAVQGIKQEPVADSDDEIEVVDEKPPEAYKGPRMVQAIVKIDMERYRSIIDHNSSCRSDQMIPLPARDTELDRAYDIRDFYSKKDVVMLLAGPHGERHRKNIARVDALRAVAVSLLPKLWKLKKKN